MRSSRSAKLERTYRLPRGSYVVEVRDTPHGRVAVVADPYGAVFSVIQPPTAAN